MRPRPAPNGEVTRAPESASGGFALSFPPELVDAIAQRVVERLEGTAVAAGGGEPEAWIGVDEAARYLGKARSRLYDLAAEGAVRHGRDGRSLLFRRSDLDAYLLRHESTEDAA